MPYTGRTARASRAFAVARWTPFAVLQAACDRCFTGPVVAWRPVLGRRTTDNSTGDPAPSAGE